MDILNNSIVTDADTEALDSQITQISNDFAETYYFDNEQEEELELLVAKAMKLGELYERKKWQAKAQAVPEENALLSATLDAVQKLGSGEFVLLKNDSKTIVAIEQMVEQQVEASGMDSRCLERLDGEKILQAAIEAQEST
ncbi:hypothetical protein [Acinetobacter radioresistens]|uniref:hypothetical protein n=1 Tax=Acinetobacter radioresistens TaxID=40216 RepID=UPI0032154F37